MVIENNVIIGAGTVIKNYVGLRKNIVIGKDCHIDSRLSILGNHEIDDNVTLRYDTIIALGCKVGNNVYICSRVMTNNLDIGKNQIGGNCLIEWRINSQDIRAISEAQDLNFKLIESVIKFKTEVTPSDNVSSEIRDAKEENFQ